jgi:hypothetical protein
MSNNLKIHHRKSIRLKGFDYSRAGGYFVTVVSYHREYLFGKVEGRTMCVNALGKIAQEYWDDILVHFENVNVDIFVVMPNHVHGILFVRENDTVHVEAQHDAPLPTTVSAPLRGRPQISNQDHWEQLSVHSNLPSPDGLEVN